jgi:hypothetical protein
MSILKYFTKSALDSDEMEVEVRQEITTVTTKKLKTNAGPVIAATNTVLDLDAEDSDVIVHDPDTTRKTKSNSILRTPKHKQASPFQPNVRFPPTHFVGEHVEALWTDDDDYEGLFYNAIVQVVNEDGTCDLLFTDDKKFCKNVPPNFIKKITSADSRSAMIPDMEPVKSDKARLRKANYVPVSTSKSEPKRKEVMDLRKLANEHREDGIILKMLENGMHLLVLFRSFSFSFCR